MRASKTLRKTTKRQPHESILDKIDSTKQSIVNNNGQYSIEELGNQTFGQEVDLPLGRDHVSPIPTQLKHDTPLLLLSNKQLDEMKKALESQLALQKKVIEGFRFIKEGSQ